MGYNETPSDYFSSCHVLQLLLPLCETVHPYRRQKLTHQQQNVLGPQARGDVHGTQGVESAGSTAIKALRHDGVTLDMVELCKSPHDGTDPGAALAHEFLECNHGIVEAFLGT